MVTRDLDPLLVETLANHFEGATAHGLELELGFGGARMTARVERILDGDEVVASIFFHLFGGALGARPIFASIAGYGPGPAEAVVEGACLWSHTFGPVLRAAIGGEDQSEVDRFDVTIHRLPFRVFIAGIDRMTGAGDPDTDSVSDHSAAIRERWTEGSKWLARNVTASGLLPLLPARSASLLSVFVWDGPEQRLVEVKVNGRDWPGFDAVFAHVPQRSEGPTYKMRELAVLVPLATSPPLERDAIVQTVAALTFASTDGNGAATSWRGWHAHGGALGQPMGEDTLARVERDLGPLPDDYRSFVRDVQAQGMGPGYGLLPPSGEAQRKLARGEFTWSEGSLPDGDPGGVLALAHAGCGLVWLLVLRGGPRGQVWLDARRNEEVVRCVAPSFDAWFRDWLDAAMRGSTPWSTWDSRRCSPASVLSQLAVRLEKEPTPEAARRFAAGTKVALAAAGDDTYFAHRALIDPCHPCLERAAALGVPETAFSRGVLLFGLDPTQGGPVAPSGGVGQWLRALVLRR